VQAYVGEITPEGSEGYSMGLFNLSMFSSLSLGPLFGGVIKDVWSMDAAFASMGVLSVVGLILCLVFLPPLSEEVIRSRERAPVTWPVLIRNKSLLGLFSFRLAYTACIGVIWCFLPLYADRQFSLSSSATGLLVMLGVFVSGVLHLPMGWISDRASKYILVGSGGVICVIGMLLLTLAQTYNDLLFAVVVFGIGGGISMPSIMALAVIKGEEAGAMASVMSVLTVAHSLGMLAGSMAAGVLMDFINLRFAFPFAMAIMVLGTGVFLWIGPAAAARED
ncbi:MAG: MFS transporter, partial [Desulfobacteraceae bacterium]